MRRLLIILVPTGKLSRECSDTFKARVSSNSPAAKSQSLIQKDWKHSKGHEIEKGKPVYLICQSGLRSYIASRILEGNGYETYNFSGGFRFYDVVVNDRVLIERSYVCGMDY